MAFQIPVAPEEKKQVPPPAAPATGGGFTIPQAPPPSTAEDVIRSTGAGIRQGLEGIPGMLGDIPALGRMGTSWLAGKLGASEDTQKAITDYDIPYVPDISTANVHAATAPFFGESYQPQTQAGKFARSIGEFGGGAVLGPGGLLRKAGQTVAGGILSEGLGQAAEGTEYEPWARAAGGIAGGSMGGAPFVAPKISEAEHAARSAAEKAGVKLTKGQATGDVAQQMQEESLRHGGRGPWAMRLMKQRDEANKTALDAHGIDIRDTMAPGRGADPIGSADTLNWSARRYVDRMKKEGGEKIDEALKAGVWVDANKLNGLQTHLADAMEGRGKGTGVPEFVIDELSPTAQIAVKRIQNFVDNMPKGTAEVNLAGIEQLRRQLGALSGANPNDARVLGAVKKAYDTWMDDAVDTGVRRTGQGSPLALPGPGVRTTEEVLADLKEGRSIYRKGMELENPKKGVEGSSRVKDIAKEGAVPEATLRFFTPDNNGNLKPDAGPAIEQLQKHFPQGSPEMAQIKDMVLAQLTQGDAGRIASRVNNFVTNNPSVAKRLFSEQELSQLKDWGAANKRMVPDPKAINPSKSSYGIMNKIGEKAGNMATIAGGFLAGGPGAIAGSVIDTGLKYVPNLLGARAAKKALAEPSRDTLTKTIVEGGGRGAIPGGRELLYSVDDPGSDNNGMKVRKAPDQPKDSNFVRIIRPDGKTQLIGKNLLKAQ